MTQAQPLNNGVAGRLGPLVGRVLKGEPLIRMRFWDGSALGPKDALATALFNSPAALRRLFYAPNELGLARAYVSGEIDIQGDIFEIFGLRDSFADERGEATVTLGGLGWLGIAGAAFRLGALGPPPSLPPEEARLHGRRHSRSRDRGAIAHHYDISNDFYRMVLGETMTYSCAYFTSPEAGLDEAQGAKYDLVCRKLGLSRECACSTWGAGGGAWSCMRPSTTEWRRSE